MIYGIGIDVVDVPRFKSAMEKRGERFCQRLFTEAELAYCLKKRSPERHLAARFAVKVSLFKALGRHLKFRDVEIANDASGKPIVIAPKLPGDLKINISITHDAHLSLAETIVEKIE